MKEVALFRCDVILNVYPTRHSGWELRKLCEFTKKGFRLWCQRWESNPHPLNGDRILSPARLPIPPLWLKTIYGPFFSKLEDQLSLTKLWPLVGPFWIKFPMEIWHRKYSFFQEKLVLLSVRIY